MTNMSKAEAWFPVQIQLVDEVMPRLKDTEWRVLLVVLRQTAGRQAGTVSTVQDHQAERTPTKPKHQPTKRRDWISHSQLCRRTGRGSGAVSAAVASLTASGLIVVEDAAGTALATPEERRRCLGRLYFRPGDKFAPSVENKSAPPVDKWITQDFSHPGKPKTTTY